MKEIVNNLLERLSKYDWFTILLPGIFFTLLSKYAGIALDAKNWYEKISIAFFAGIVCSRIGATIVEWIARRKTLALFSGYEDYLEWIDSNPESAQMLIRNANWFRSLTGMMLLLISLKATTVICAMLHTSTCTLEYIAMLGLLILFADSYRRQLSFIKRRINKYKSSTTETPPGTSGFDQ